MKSEAPRSDTVETIDLTNCDREPIHQLGRVQSYGALVALSSDWIVQHASTNLGSILGVSLDDALGKQLSDLVVSDGFERIREAVRATGTTDTAVRMFDVTMRARGKSFDVSAHRSGDLLIVEFEPKVAHSGRDAMSGVYPHIAALQRDGDFATLVRDAAAGLRALSGFDSVMVYEFQPDKSGKVIAESRADGRSKYLGLMFPASDIPVQARALYKRSLLRLIADVNDEGSVIRPGVTLDGSPLDLSIAVTRAVSPIHIQYLKNMGVQASMSVSIMKDGELWGLFACHHDTPRYIDYESRTSIEMYAHLFSYEISRFEEQQRKLAERGINRLQTRLMSHLAEGRHLSDSLLAVSQDIGAVIPHDGMVLCEDGVMNTIGSVPSREDCEGLIKFLDRSVSSEVFATEHIAGIYPPGQAFAEQASGLLVIPVSRMPRDYLMLLRRQVHESVSWAGDPHKPVTVGPNGVQLTPRNSFEEWRETVAGRSAAWSQDERYGAEMLRTVLLEVFLKITDANNMERKRAQEQQQLLVSELNHRVRNILNLMRGLISQSRSSATTLAEFTSNLDGRIIALSQAHDQITAEKWEPTSLKSLIICEFEAYADSKRDRVRITGPDALITPDAYTTLALVLHEMATNSIKYGALCDQEGYVSIDLTMDSNKGLLIDWVESGGPPVKAPTRRGFGTQIIENSIPHELRGHAEVSYAPTGLEAHFRLPANVIAQFVDEQVDPAPRSAPAAQGNPGFTLSGKGMVLEDALIIAMDAAGIIEDLGAGNVEILSSVGSALDWLEGNSVDFALLDVNLGDEQSLPVAQMLAERGVPFVLATGYGATEELTDTYPDCVILQKPFTQASLRDALAKALSR